MPARRVRARLATAAAVALTTSALVGTLVPPLIGSASAAPSKPTGPDADADSGLGQWTVRERAAGAWVVTWRSPTPLPVGSDRPTIVPSGSAPQRLTVGPPTVAGDGRTVTALVTGPSRPDAEQLDVLLSGSLLDEPDGGRESDEVGSQSTRRPSWKPPVRRLLKADPGSPGRKKVVSSDYHRPGITLPGMRRKVEVRGHVVRPARGTGPLVLFLHGRHESCYSRTSGKLSAHWPCRAGQRPVPSHLGYDYLQRHLASQGFVTVSISANGINAQDHRLADGGAEARAMLIRRHLRLWSTSKRLPDARLRSVVLVGHSRGGEGVARAALETPLTAPYRIAGQVLLAPTDFSRQATPYVPTVTLLPSCDGDVVDLQGQAYVDVARDLATDETTVKSSLLVVGANHNFFNTEWTPRIAVSDASDDWGRSGGPCRAGSADRLTAAEQRNVGAAYVAGAVRLFARGERRFSPLYDGSAVRLRSTRGSVVLSHMVGGGRSIRRPAIDATPTTPTAGATGMLCHGVTSLPPVAGECAVSTGGRPAMPHWPTSFLPMPEQQALELRWQRRGAGGGLDLSRPLNVHPGERLVLRVVADNRQRNTRVRLRVTDADGRTVTLRARRLAGLPHGPAWHAGAHWAQELSTPATALKGIDRSEITRVELLGAQRRGHLWLLDVAAAPGRTQQVPPRRMPFVDLGSLRTDEGEGPQVARIPYTVRGTLTTTARFRVYGYNPWTGATRKIDVTVPPGTKRGSVQWSYAGNSRSSLDDDRYDLMAYGMSRIAVRSYLGRLVIVDDDPLPTLSLERVRSTAVEGRRAAWTVSVSTPVEFDMLVQLRAVKAPGTPPAVRASDIPRRWLRRWAFVEPGTDPPLHRTDFTVMAVLEAGERSVTFRVPIARDAKRERRKAFTVQGLAPEIERQTGRRTVIVTDR